MASRRGLRRRQCRSKIAWPTEGAAHAARRRTGDTRLWVYHCAWGGHWHVGHPSRKLRAAAGRMAVADLVLT